MIRQWASFLMATPSGVDAPSLARTVVQILSVFAVEVGHIQQKQPLTDFPYCTKITAFFRSLCLLVSLEAIKGWKYLHQTLTRAMGRTNKIECIRADVTSALTAAACFCVMKSSCGFNFLFDADINRRENAIMEIRMLVYLK